MSTKIPVLRDIKVRREVLEGTYQSAIDVTEIDKGTAPEFLRDPVEFFKRTAVTPGVKALVVKTLMALLNMREAVVGGIRYTVMSKLFILPSLFGGGKSHALATVYHVVKAIASSRTPGEAYEKLAVLDKDIAEFVRDNWNRLAEVKPKVVLVHGQYGDYAPSPFDDKPVKSIWGYIAEKLGEYQVMYRYDEEFTAPPTEVLERVLSGKGAVMLIDEIAYYYSRVFKRGSREYVDVVNSFLFGLSSLLGSKEVPSVAVVLTLPYSHEKSIVEKAHAGLLDVLTIKKILDRTRPEVVVVAKPEDLATIIRKRVFEEPPEKLESLGRQVAKAIIREVPADDVKRMLSTRGFEDALGKTYPVHPETIETLKSLHSMLSEHLQLARSPITMVVEAVKAVRDGCFDWMGFEPHLLMPYHIPVFDEQVLVASLPATEPELYRFKHILEESIVKMGRGEGKCFPSIVLSNYVSTKAYEPPVYAMAVYIWLRSLPGRGLVSNRDLYPTSDRVAYAILEPAVTRDEKWYDAKATLENEVRRLPYVNEDDDHWFFKWTPRISELIARYAKDITDAEVNDYLVDLVESMFKDDEKEPGHGQRIVFTDKMSNMLLINRADVDPSTTSVIVYTHRVSEDELKIPYNNVIVLLPDTTTPIPLDEVKRYEIPPVPTYWEALRTVIRYAIACEEKLTRDVLREIYRDEAERDPNVVELLSRRVADAKDKYARRARELFMKVYGAIRLRQSPKPMRLVYPQQEKSLFSVIEYSLLNQYIFSSVDEDWVLNIGMRLGAKVDDPEGISLSNIWHYLLTGEGENIPVVSLDWFARNALQPVKKLGYAVVVRDRIYWKQVYASRGEAVQALQASGMSMDELPQSMFEKLVQAVKSMIRNGEDVRLVSYVHVWKQWLEQETRNLQGEILVVTDGRQERVLDRELVEREPTLHLLLKSGAVFREKLKVKIETESPMQVEAGESIPVTVKLSSTSVREARLKISVSGAKPESLEKTVHIPFEEKMVLEQLEGAREVRVSITVEDPAGGVLGRHETLVAVRRPETELRVEVVGIEEARRVSVEEVRSIEVLRTEDFFKILPLLEEIGGEATVSAVFNKLRIETQGAVSINEAEKLVNAIHSLKTIFTLSSFALKMLVPEDKTRRTDILQRLPVTGGIRVEVLSRDTRG